MSANLMEEDQELSGPAVKLKNSQPVAGLGFRVYSPACLRNVGHRLGYVGRCPSGGHEVLQ